MCNILFYCPKLADQFMRYNVDELLSLGNFGIESVNSRKSTLNLKKNSDRSVKVIQTYTCQKVIENFTENSIYSMKY